MTTAELIAKCRDILRRVDIWNKGKRLYWCMSLATDGEADELWCECLGRLEKAEAENEQRKAALERLIYEVTHLSPCEDDGSHWCKISAEVLQQARVAYSQTPDGKRPATEAA